MELLKLDRNTYLPESTVERWKSLIWTERFSEFGEFELVMSDFENAITFLPLGTLLSLRDTSEMMIVDTHDVKYDEQGRRMFVVKGRSASSILDDRDGTLANMHIMSLKNGTQPLTSMTTYEYIKQMISYLNYHNPNATPINSNEDYTMMRMYGAGIDSGPSKQYDLDIYDQGSAYSIIKKWLDRDGQGFGVDRPGYYASDKNLPYNSGGTMGFYVNSGRPYQSNRGMKLNVKADQVDNYSYIQSMRNYKNVAYVITDLNTTPQLSKQYKTKQVTLGMQSATDTPTVYRGFDRKVLTVVQEGLSDDASLNMIQWSLGRNALLANNRITWLDATMANDTVWKYRTHYYLGDVISIQIGSATDTIAMINEVVRTEDENGEFIKPAFVMV